MSTGERAAHPVVDPTARLDAVLAPAAAAWLDEACRAASADPAGVRRTFPAVGRRLGREPLSGGGVHAWTVDDAGRARLLRAALGGAGGQPGAAPADVLDRLYTHGDASERRGVLRALDVLPADVADAAGGLDLVRDALRTNDARLVAAAAGGRYAARGLPDAELEQAVLKCLFVGIPLDGLAALPGRSTARLARMVADFARERIAAGRDVPSDAWLVLRRHPEAVDATGLRSTYPGEG